MQGVVAVRHATYGKVVARGLIILVVHDILSKPEANTITLYMRRQSVELTIQ